MRNSCRAVTVTVTPSVRLTRSLELVMLDASYCVGSFLSKEHFRAERNKPSVLLHKFLDLQAALVTSLLWGTSGLSPRALRSSAIRSASEASRMWSCKVHEKPQCIASCGATRQRGQAIERVVALQFARYFCIDTVQLYIGSLKLRCYLWRHKRAFKRALAVQNGLWDVYQTSCC